MARQPGLFDSLCDTQPLLTQSLTGSSRASRLRSLQGSNAPSSKAAILEQAHLRAAKRLSQAIRAQKADRAKQVMTGNAICQHLLAVLEASELDSDVGSESMPPTGHPTQTSSKTSSKTSSRTQADH